VTALVVRVGGEQRADEKTDRQPTAMDALHSLAERIAASTASVLVHGETGAGKEVLAELIHRKSPRAERPLVKVNCAAITPSLFESQMFGHEKGAFTGAVETQPGMIEAADGGTLFLDEVAELPLELQAKLLRVIEDRIVTRVGAVHGEKVDVRFIAASNEDLRARVDAGKFRADLYFRLAGVMLHIPPLRERADEIVPLAELFVSRAGGATFSAAALAQLRAYAWPGNIRQLRNVVERAVMMCDGGAIEPKHLAFEEPRRIAPPEPSPDRPLDPNKPQDLVDALALCAGNQTRAARMLGISRNTLLARLDQFGLPRPRKKG
jgi:DNA-binding NtrC family response regulator